MPTSISPSDDHVMSEFATVFARRFDSADSEYDAPCPSSPAAADDPRVDTVVTFGGITPTCACCRALNLACHFAEAGFPCPRCWNSSHECEFSTVDFFVDNLAAYQYNFLEDDHALILESIALGALHPSLYIQERYRAYEWFYSVGRGACTRFRVNVNATKGLTRAGLRMLFSTV
ncbi:hypothetical protein FB45DRAFT_1052718 [Roridomyces roridus]|uniref:Uncharacterized protein n=1 Tax=Roridomyces roridus TaxID=1738132 RepID=A0AAD7CAH9_9AGAR|nr:hypothetical protein FB45DRAFT_1052718 [Roridomyces roridus]